MNRYRIVYDGFQPHIPGCNFASVIYHNRTHGATPSSCQFFILDIDDRWNTDLL